MKIMSNNKHLNKVISSDSQTAYERWEAPHVQSLQQQEEQHAGRVTARQLEDLQKQAYEEGLQSGRDEGYPIGLTQGIDAGRRQGLEEGRNEAAQIVKRLTQILTLLAEPLEQVNKSVEEELLALSMATARQIIRREITINPEQIVAVVKEAISILPSASQRIKVYLNPFDAEIIRESLQLSSDDSAKENPTMEERWSIIEDPALNRGGCHIDTENSHIDASIETRLAEIAARILGDERTGDGRKDDDIMDDEQ